MVHCAPKSRHPLCVKLALAQVFFSMKQCTKYHVGKVDHLGCYISVVLIQNGWQFNKLSLKMFWKMPLLYCAVHQKRSESLCSAELTSRCPKGVRSSKPNCVSRCYILYPSVSNQYECWSMLVCAAGSCLLCSVYSRHKSLVAGVKNSLWTIQSRQKLMLLQPLCSSVFQ